MKRYQSYKDSGVQWLGQIPDHWECVPFKSVFALGKGLSITKENLVEKGVNVISYGQIHSKQNKYSYVIPELYRFVDESYLQSNPQSLVRKEDFVFADTSEDVEGSGNFVRIDNDEEIFAGYHTIIGKNAKPESGAYLSYLMQSNLWKMQIWVQVHGIKVFSITRGILNSTKLFVPPLSEQHSIVSYLDDKCAKIDKSIENMEKQIALLQEMKQRVIADAVTRGLDKTVKMKKSGIAWLDEVPEHWEMRKMKYVFEERSEKNHPNEPMLSATQTEGVILQSKYKNRVVVVTTGFEGLKLVKVGDFVIHLRSFQGGIEYAYDQGIISSAYTVLIPLYKECSEYYKYLFKSSCFIDLLKICVTGIREGQNINYSKLKQCLIPLPPIEEQRAIVSYINERTAKIETLAKKLEQEIEYLKEYKQRLISDVVTGQVKVC